MLASNKSLLSYFDEPVEGDALACEALSKWAEYEGKTVFVPNFPKWLKPENKPKKQVFHEKGTPSWNENEWGFSHNIYDRIATAKENKRILEDYRARGEEPPPGCTVHLPGTPWRPSDEGFNQGNYEWSMAAKEAKMNHIRGGVQVIREHGETLQRWLFVMRKEFVAPEDDALIGILASVVKEFGLHQKNLLILKDRYEFDGVRGKAKTELLEKMKRDVHSRKVHALPEFSQRWSGYMLTIKQATDSLGMRNFLGTEFPEPNARGEHFIYVIMAVCGTAKQQIMRVLAVKHKNAGGVTQQYAEEYAALEDSMSMLKCLTNHVKVGLQYKRHVRGHYPDSAKLEDWYAKHDPGPFFL